MTGPSLHGSDDADFRELVIDVLERLEHDESSALEDACRAHPALEKRLRRRVEALRRVGLIGAGATSPGRIGDFRLIEEIGAGGMGVVYRAEQEALGREVAVKLIRPEILGLSRARERFARETEIVARLQHPGIVPIYTVGGTGGGAGGGTGGGDSSGDVPFYAMEWVRGCTLGQALEELVDTPAAERTGALLQRAIRARAPSGSGAAAADDASDTGDAGAWLFEGSWQEVCLRIVLQVADALEHAHRRGVLHRDVKPGNVLVTPGGRVMLVDFGLSHSEGDEPITHSGERLGSLPYMSPELLRSGPLQLDRRSDVYSLGVMLYQLLTLALPFTAPSEPAAMQRILEGRPTPPRQHRPDLSWEAETLCLVAMDRDPERRYQTAAAFARDVSNALERRPVEARRASLRLRAWRWIERRPGEASAIALAVVLAISVPSLIAWFQSREARHAKASLALVTAEQERTEAQRGRAEENYGLALDTVDTLLRKVGEEDLDHVPRLVELRGKLAEAAEKVYHELQRRQPDDPELARLEAGSKRLRVGALLAHGRHEEAEALMVEAIATLAPWLEGGSYELRRMHALCLLGRAQLEIDPQRHVEALTALHALTRERPEDRELRGYLVQYSRMDAELSFRSGDPGEAFAALERTEADARDIVAAEPLSHARIVLAKVLDEHGTILWSMGRFDEARAKLQEALDLNRAVFAEDPAVEFARAGVAGVAVRLGGVLAQMGLDEESLVLLDEAREELDWLLAEYPGNPTYAADLAELHKNRGITLARLGAHEEALETLELALASYHSTERRFPHERDFAFEYGIVHVNLALVRRDLGDFDGALETIDTARRIIEDNARRYPDHPDAAMWLGVERISRADVLLAIPRPAEAAEALADAPRLVGPRIDRVDQALRRLAVCLRKARASGDGEEQRRTLSAARRGLESAEARGDANNLASMSSLRDLVEIP